MLISTLLAAAIWPTIVTKECGAQTDASMVGIARNESDKVLYCEIVTKNDSSSLKVSYFSGGQLFAEKSLDFSTNPFAPSVLQKDARVGELRRARVSEQNIELAYQPNEHKKINQVLIPRQKVDVVDAGFDNFIRANWDRFKSGETISVNFGSMAHLKTLPLRVRSQPVEKCQIKQNKNSSMTCFFVEIDNALLRIVLGNIKITYDEKRRLSEFNGVVNIEDEEQDNQKAIITYFYKEDYLKSNN